MTTRPRARFLAALLSLGLVATLAGRAAAEEPGDDEISTRLARIESNFADGKAYANIWWVGWLTIQLGSAAVFGSLAIAYHDEPDAPANGVTGALGLASGALLLAIPMVPAYAPYKLRQLPEDTPEARREKLARAEDYLRRSADYEEMGRAPYMHLVNFGFAAAAGLLLAFAFDDTDWKDGLYNFGLLFAVSELQIATQPTRAIEDWKAYRRLYCPPSNEKPATAKGFALPGAAALEVLF